MADEIELTVRLSAAKTGGTVTISTTKRQTLTGNGKVAITQIVGFAADEALEFPADIIAEGVRAYAVINLGAYNVQFSTGTGGSFAAGVFAELAPGEPLLIPINKAAASAPTVYVQAATAACSIQNVIVGT